VRRRDFVTSLLAGLMGLMGTRHDPERPVPEPKTGEWWCSADYTETSGDGKVVTKTIYWKLT
jgi:hypothetical protein